MRSTTQGTVRVRFFARYAELVGKEQAALALPLPATVGDVVRRDGQLVTLDTTVRERTTSTAHLSKAPNPDVRAARLWQGLATGTVGN